MMIKGAEHILDMHTHKAACDSNSVSIINYPLLPDSPMEYVEEGESPCGTLTDNMFGPKKGYFYSVGMHPWELTERNAAQQLRLIKKLIVRKQFVAIGEAGLDKLATASMELQIKMFKEQVILSEKRELPLIIHCVKAMEELLSVKKELSPKQPWIWHGFRGTPEQAAQLLKKGFYLSFGARYSDDTLVSVPANRLFLETDAANVDIASVLTRAAQTRGVEVDILRDTIHENMRNVFFKG